MSSRALAQARQAQADHVQAVEEVLAERALAHALLEVLVRGGDDAHVGLDLLVAADAVEVPSESTRSRRVCSSGGMSPISSRNSVPPSACSKRPRRCCCAPVKEPRSWPNSSDSSRSLGIAAVLIAMNGFGRARTVPVQRARDKLLAGARLAGDQHRRARLREPADGAEHLLHRRRLAEDFRGLARAARWPRVSRRLSSSARRISSTAWSTSKGLGRYS